MVQCNTTLGDAWYLIIITDDFSGKVFGLLLTNCEALSSMPLVETRASKQVWKSISNNGGEFISHATCTFCLQKTYCSSVSCPNSSQQKGVAEVMSSQHDLPRNFWGKAVHTSVYIINHRPPKAVVKMTPKELFTLQVKNPCCLTLCVWIWCKCSYFRY